MSNCYVLYYNGHPILLAHTFMRAESMMHMMLGNG